MDIGKPGFRTLAVPFLQSFPRLIIAVLAFTISTTTVTPGWSDQRGKVITQHGHGSFHSQAGPSQGFSRARQRSLGRTIDRQRQRVTPPRFGRAQQRSLQRSISRHRRGGHNCRITHKPGHDVWGNPAMISVTVCHNAWGRAYILKGSRHVVRRHR